MEPTTPAAEGMKSTFLAIRTDQVKPSPYQARKDFNEEAIKSLADSIALEGLLQPITVRKVQDGYELISGERRVRAMKLLGKPTIEAHIVEVPSEASAAAKGLIENHQRKDLNPIEEAEGFDRLNKLDSNLWTHEKIASIIGEPRIYVTKSIGLLGLPEEVKENVRQRTLNREHAIELTRLSNTKEIKRLVKKVGKKGLSAKELRRIIDKKQGKTPSAGDRDRDRDGEQHEKDKKVSQGWQFNLTGNQLSVQGLVTLESGEDPVEILFQSLQTAYAAWVTGNTAPAMDKDDDLTPEEALRLIQEAEKLKG